MAVIQHTTQTHRAGRVTELRTLFQAKSSSQSSSNLVPSSAQRQIQHTGAQVDALVVKDGRGLAVLARAMVDDVCLTVEKLCQVLLELGPGEQGAVFHLQGLIGVEGKLQTRYDLLDLVLLRQQLLSNETKCFRLFR
jgi:hypothetical protein